MIIMALDGSIKGVYELDRVIFSQPEGMGFSPTDNLFMAYEGTEVGGNLLKFKRTK